MTAPYRGLDAALARNSGPSAEDVEALAEEVWNDEPTAAELDLMRLVMKSDWLTAHTAAAEARGAERGARAVVEAVERLADLFEESGRTRTPRDWRSAADSLRAAARAAAARVEGGA